MQNSQENVKLTESSSKAIGSPVLWAYVTVFGTLWGGMELTLGTFLHTLHVPKTGLIMVTLSVILLIAQRQVFPKRGTTLATGVIAGFIKCLSPGGIILGPLFGILTEALFVELVLLMAPRRLISAMLAGGLTVLWCQIQGFVKQIIYYSGDIIDVYIKLIRKFLGSGWEGKDTVVWIVAGIVAVIFFIGTSAGLSGFFLGKKVRKRIKEASEKNMTDISSENTDLETENSKIEKNAETDRINDGKKADDLPIIGNTKHGHRREADETIIRSRKWVLPFALITIILQFSGIFWASVASIAVFFIALFVFSRNVLKAIWWPKFWLVTVIVCGLAGAILAWDFDSQLFNIGQGVLESLKMLMRGAYVFALLTWATRCVRPQEVIALWSKCHLEQMGIAITTSYELLPIWLQKFNGYLKKRPSGFGAGLRYVHQCMVEGLAEAALQAEEIAKNAWNEKIK